MEKIRRENWENFKKDLSIYPPPLDSFFLHGEEVEWINNRGSNWGVKKKWRRCKIKLGPYRKSLRWVYDIELNDGESKIVRASCLRKL